MNHILKPKIPILVGPTASGKSTLALQLAKHIPIEIISVDSALVYKGMDIGTAKPSLLEQSEVKHHLLDIIDPVNSYSAMQFCTDATRLIADILARQHLPLLVGGTMLYVKALLQGLDELPPAHPEIRAQLDVRLQQEGIASLYNQLQMLDEVTATRLNVSDTQRILRALEVCLISGRPFSSWHTHTPKQMPYEYVLFSLENFERKVLHERIAQRLDHMFAHGFIDEVKGLKARSDLSLALPSMRCVGYRQVWEYLDGTLNEQQMRDQSLFATRQLAKRQYTWLRAMPQRIILEANPENFVEKCQEIWEAQQN